MLADVVCPFALKENSLAHWIRAGHKSKAHFFELRVLRCTKGDTKISGQWLRLSQLMKNSLGIQRELPALGMFNIPTNPDWTRKLTE